MTKQNPEILNNQAILLASQGNFDEAIACLNNAITSESDNFLLWYNLAITYRDKGDYKSSHSAMEQAFRLNPYNEDILEAYSELMIKLKNYDDAIVYCTIGLQENINNTHLWNQIGVIHFNLNDYKGASEAFEHALLINPYYYEALFNLRDTYKELHNKSGYEECCRRLKQIKKGKDK